MGRVVAASWVGNTVGASNPSNRQGRSQVLDGYSTPAVAVQELLGREDFHRNVWEPANGYHKISKVLEDAGHITFTSDIKRWCRFTDQVRAFQQYQHRPFKDCDVLTNPPFSQAQEFVETAMRLLRPGAKLALLLRVQFLEGRKRKLMFEKYPPRRVWVFSYCLPRMHRFDWKGKRGGSQLAFAWFVWIKGYEGPTIIKWI